EEESGPARTGAREVRRNRWSRGQPDDDAQRLATLLQQGPAGNTGTCLQELGNHAADVAAGEWLDEEREVELRPNAAVCGIGLHERLGRRNVFGETRRAIASGTRSDRQGRTAMCRQGLRASGFAAG